MTRDNHLGADVCAGNVDQSEPVCLQGPRLLDRVPLQRAVRTLSDLADDLEPEAFVAQLTPAERQSLVEEGPCLAHWLDCCAAILSEEVA